MGVAWVFELISLTSWVWLVLLESIILYSGVFIFYMFVCKKDIIRMLIKRLVNISMSKALLIKCINGHI